MGENEHRVFVFYWSKESWQESKSRLGILGFNSFQEKSLNANKSCILSVNLVLRQSWLVHRAVSQAKENLKQVANFPLFFWMQTDKQK